MTDGERTAAIVGFLAGAGVAVGGIVVYATSRKWDIAKAIGDAAIPVIDSALADPTLPAPLPAVLGALQNVPQWRALKNRLAYDILGKGVVEGIGL